jgi:hypothetical protein
MIQASSFEAVDETAHHIGVGVDGPDLVAVGAAALEHLPEARRRCFASPRLVAPAPYHRLGDSPWPDKYCSWSVASSRV